LLSLRRDRCCAKGFQSALKLFGLTDAELEKLLADPEQLLAIADILEASQ